MPIDVTDLHAFYASPLGDVARRVVGRALDRFLDNPRGLDVLGLGYAVPYLSGLDGRCGRVLAFMPGSQGVMNWPAGGRSASALVDPLTMPLPDGCVDRVLVVHAIEAAENPAELLHEVWRVLTPGGRLVLVCPNRRGVWARMDRTPFGHGQPYSRSQLRHLLRVTQFVPDRWQETLYMPPFRGRLLLRTAPAWEGLGRALALPVSGLHVLEASKQLHRPVLVRASRRVRGRRPAFAPAAAACDVHGP